MNLLELATCARGSTLVLKYNTRKKKKFKHANFILFSLIFPYFPFISPLFFSIQYLSLFILVSHYISLSLSIFSSFPLIFLYLTLSRSILTLFLRNLPPLFRFPPFFSFPFKRHSLQRPATRVFCSPAGMNL